MTRLLSMDEVKFDLENLDASMAEASRALMADPDVAVTVERIAEWSTRAVPEAAAASVVMRRRRGRLECVAHRGDSALVAEQAQAEQGEGPTRDVILGGEACVRAFVCAGQEPWPDWSRRAALAGVAGVVSVPLVERNRVGGHDYLGAISFYSGRGDSFDDDAFRRAELFGVHAGNALAAAQQITTLGEAVEARHQIGLAQGVLIARYGLSEEQAFDVLARYSSHMNMKLHAVAGHVVSAGELPASYAEVEGLPQLRDHPRP